MKRRGPFEVPAEIAKGVEISVDIETIPVNGPSLLDFDYASLEQRLIAYMSTTPIDEEYVAYAQAHGIPRESEPNDEFAQAVREKVKAQRWR